MSIITSKLELFQAVMPMVGANVPASLDATLPETIALNAFYEIMVKAALEGHGWSFSTTEAALTYQGETDSLPLYSYTLPSDVMTPRICLLAGQRFREFELRGGKLLCNLFEAENFTMIYTYRALESTWTAQFTLAMLHRAAGYLCNGLLDRPEQGEALDRKADRLLAKAKRNDRNTFQGPVGQADPVLVMAWQGQRERRTPQGLVGINTGKIT